MSDLVGNPKDRFSINAAHICSYFSVATLCQKFIEKELLKK